jgi:hypothetical protein
MIQLSIPIGKALRSSQSGKVTPPSHFPFRLAEPKAVHVFELGSARRSLSSLPPVSYWLFPQDDFTALFLTTSITLIAFDGSAGFFSSCRQIIEFFLQWKPNGKKPLNRYVRLNNAGRTIFQSNIQPSYAHHVWS